MERAEARAAAPDRIRLFDSGNANQTGSRPRAAFEAGQQNFLGSNPDGRTLGVEAVRLEDAIEDGVLVLEAEDKFKQKVILAILEVKEADS